MVQLRSVHHDLHVLWRGAGTMHVQPAGHAFTMKAMQLAEEGRTLAEEGRRLAEGPL